MNMWVNEWIDGLGMSKLINKWVTDWINGQIWKGFHIHMDEGINEWVRK